MKIKNVVLQALAFGLLPMGASAQKQVSIDWFGFVAAQSFFNTHESASAAEGFLYLYPTDRVLDNDGNDLKQRSFGSEFGTMARIGFNLHGPEIFGASSRATA